MASPVGSILRKVNRTDKKYNILTGCTHESYETNLAKTGHNFYAYQHPSFKFWNESFRSIPDNYYILNKDLKEEQIPIDLQFDFVLSQNKFGQFQVLSQLAKRLHLPIISIEHTLPPEFWNRDVFENAKNMKGDINLFISEYSANKWGFKVNNLDTKVVHHGIDTGVFVDRKEQRENVLLSVVNDWINRDYFCGFRLWQDVTKDLPVAVYGSTPGLSRATSSIDELVDIHNKANIFLNTSLVSPIPMALLEAMSSGCCPVTTATCMIPEIIEHGKNGLMSNNPNELREFCIKLLNEPEYARELGENARKTIEERFSLFAFINKWNSIFDEAYNIVFIGEHK